MLPDINMLHCFICTPTSYKYDDMILSRCQAGLEIALQLSWPLQKNAKKHGLWTKPFWTKPCTHHLQRSINYPWSLRSIYNVGTHAVWIAAVWGQFCLPDLPDGIPPTFSPCSAASLSGASKRYSMKVTRTPAEVIGRRGHRGGHQPLDLVEQK